MNETMLNDIAKQVAQKTGLPEAQARQAVDVVVGYLRQQMSQGGMAQITQLLGGADNPLSGVMGGLLGK